MSREPPGTPRVTKLLAGLAFRRWRNRFVALRAKVKPGRRTATARKSARSNWIFFLIGVTAAMALQRTGSLWAAIGVHATYNLLVVAVLPQVI